MNAKTLARARVLFISFCFLLLTASLAGCAASGISSGTAGSETTTAAGEIAEKEQKLDETVFPKDKIIDVKITINEDDFQHMLDNASAEEYKEATVEYNGQTFENVGIRTKGNLSLNSVVRMDDSDRYSFKISFDEYVNQTLEGISKINLNNNYSDATYMREFISYELAESMGLPTPKFSFVNVYVNGELWGFYLAVEQIGDAYLERNFGNAYGALYKANGGTGSELNWLETIDAYTGLELKSDKSNDDGLLDMLNELNNGTDYESVLDVEEALKFIALNTVSGNFDSYLGQNKHNYYLYENEGIFSVLPWDYNMSFGGFGGAGVRIDEPTSGALADRPLVAKLLQVDAYKEQYHQIIADMLEGYLDVENFQARIGELKEMISSYVEADPSSFYTYEQYGQGIEQLLSFHAEQTSSIAKQLDGTIASAGDGSGTASGGMGGFGGGGRQNMQQNAGQGGNAAAETAEGDAPAATDNQPAQGATDAVALDNQPTQGAADAATPDNQPTQGAADAAAPDGVKPQIDAGMAPPDDQMPGQDGLGGGVMRPDREVGIGGFGGGGIPGAQSTAAQGSPKEAAATGSVLILLLLSCVLVTFYKRKRL